MPKADGRGAESGEEIVITKNGKPVSKLTPYRQRPKLLFGRNRDNIRILGDIVSSMPAEWYDHDGERGRPVLILIDTHVLLWQEQGDWRMGPRTRRTFEYALQEGDAAVSSHIILGSRHENPERTTRFSPRPEGLARRPPATWPIEIPINGEIAARASLLPNMHGDPADRLIVATALDGHTLVTADGPILDWPGNLNRMDARE